MNTIIQAHPDVNVVLGSDTLVLGALSAVRAAGKATDAMYFSGIDGETQALDEVKKGGPYKASFAYTFGLLGYAWARSPRSGSPGGIFRKSCFEPIELNSAKSIAEFQRDIKNVRNVWKSGKYISFYGNISYDSRRDYVKKAASVKLVELNLITDDGNSPAIEFWRLREWRALARRQRRFSVPGEASSRTGLWILSVALVFYFGLQYDNFLTTSNGLAIALNVTSVAIAAIGAAALLISGNVDLSIGGQYALISVVCATVVRDTGSTAAGIAVAVGCGVALGLANGVLVRLLQISPLIVTLAMMLVYHGAAFVVSDGFSVFGFPESFVSIGRDRVQGVPLPVIIAAALFAAATVFVVTSVSSLRIYAIGGNPDAARRAGIPVGRTVVALFAFNGALVGVVALLATARRQRHSFCRRRFRDGCPDSRDSRRRCVRWRWRPSNGVLAGVATIGILNAGLIFAGVSDWYQQIARGGVLILALAADQYAFYRRGQAVVWTDIQDLEAETQTSATRLTPGVPTEPASWRRVLRCRAHEEIRVGRSGH